MRSGFTEVKTSCCWEHRPQTLQGGGGSLGKALGLVWQQRTENKGAKVLVVSNSL